MHRSTVVPPASSQDGRARAGVILGPAVAGGLGGVAAAAVVLAPWWRPGALLVRDLVAVPTPGWSWQLLDPLDRLPRDVPGEVLVAAFGQVVPGDLVVRLLLVVALVALAAGAGRLVDARDHPWAGVVAGLVAIWNPFVWARLQQGQWLVVVALAAVPWVVVHLGAGDTWRLSRTMALAGVGGFVTTVVVLPTLLVVGLVTRRRRQLVIGVGVWLLVSLPWLLVSDGLAGDPDGVVAFAPNADLAGGVVPSLVTGGGYFNAAIASPWRGRVAIAVVALGLTALMLWGAWRWLTDAAPEPGERRARWGLAAAGGTGLLVALAASTPMGQRLLGTLTESVPVVAALRDSHRLVAPWVVLLATGAGVGVGRLGTRVDGSAGVAAIAAGLVVLALPDPVVGPRLPSPSPLPIAWTQAADLVDADPGPGRLLVVPYGQTQRYAFTDGRPVAVPLRRMVARPVAVDTRLVVDDIVVDERSDPLRELAARDLGSVTGRTLLAHGVSWVAITDPRRFVSSTGPGVEIAQSSPTLQLLRAAGASGPAAQPWPPIWLRAVDVLVAAAAVLLVLAPTRRHRRT